MHYINNLPVILAALSAIIVGVYGYINRFSNTTTYKYMCLFLIIFFVIGYLIKKMILEVQEEMQARNEKTSASEDLIYNDELAALAGAAGVVGAGEAGLSSSETEHPAVDGKSGAAVVKTLMTQPENGEDSDFSEIGELRGEVEAGEEAHVGDGYGNQGDEEDEGNAGLTAAEYGADDTSGGGFGYSESETDTDG